MNEATPGASVVSQPPGEVRETSAAGNVGDSFNDVNRDSTSRRTRTKTRQRGARWREHANKKRSDPGQTAEDQQVSQRRSRLRSSQGDRERKGGYGDTQDSLRLSSRSRNLYGQKQALIGDRRGWTLRNSHPRTPQPEDDATDNPADVWEGDSALSTDGISSAPSFSSSLHAVASVPDLPPRSEQRTDNVADNPEVAETTAVSAETGQWAEGFVDEDFVTGVVIVDPLAVEPVVRNNGDSGNDVDSTPLDSNHIASSGSVEEVSKADKSSWANIRRVRRLRNISLVLCVLVGLTALLAVVIITVRGRSDPEDESATTRDVSTAAESLSPSVAGLEMTPPSPTTLSVPPVLTTEARFESMATLVIDAMTLLSEEAGRQTTKDIRDENTPQARAAWWMVSEDQFLQDELDFFVEFPEKLTSFVQVEQGTDETAHRRRKLLLDRYALALLISQSADAAAWLDTLRFKDICEWEVTRLRAEDPTQDVCVEQIWTNDSSNFGGTLPPELALLTATTRLDLSSQQFTGPLPHVWGYGLINLNIFSARNNAITGTIPYSWRGLSQLRVFSLSGNKVESISFLRDNKTQESWMPSLSTINLDSNHLNVRLEDIARELPSGTMETVNLEDNNLEGTIPSSLGNVMFLSLGKNNLSGTVPDELFQNSTIRLDLKENNLTGRALPSDLGRLVSVTSPENGLTGTVPSSIWISLNTLDLSRNRISGTLPPPTSGIKSQWTGLNLASNSMTGPVPPLLPFTPRESARNIELDLSFNQFTGTIPSRLTSADDASLQVIMLQGNRLSGAVPEQFLNLRLLKRLNIQNNNIQGNISFLCFHENAAALKIFADCEGPDAPVICDCCENCKKE